MPTTPFNYGSEASSEGWLNADFAVADPGDEIYATVNASPIAGGRTGVLFAYDFAFNYPPGSTVQSISVIVTNIVYWDDLPMPGLYQLEFEFGNVDDPFYGPEITNVPAIVGPGEVGITFSGLNLPGAEASSYGVLLYVRSNDDGPGDTVGITGFGAAATYTTPSGGVFHTGRLPFILRT